MPTTTLGFTLVELAIALMVIGLLIGGVLKGQELVENARIIRMVNDFNDYDTAVMLFRDTYNGLPGDIRNPERVPNCNDGICNYAGEVLGTGIIAAYSKSNNFWRQLFYGGFISSIHDNPADPHSTLTTHTISPLNSFGAHTRMYFGYRPSEPLRNYFYPLSNTTPYHTSLAGISLNRARTLDEKMDDGRPLSGMMQIFSPFYSPAGSHGDTCHDTTTGEYLDDTSLRCVAVIDKGSLNN